MATSGVLRYGSLGLLVAQDTALVLLLRFSRSHWSPADGPMYVSSTAVLTMELVKLTVCFAALLHEHGPRRFLRVVCGDVLKPVEILKLSVPAMLYLVQNNLLYFALTKLRATPYKVTYNLKILTGAMFSVVLLGQRLGARKWFSLFVLFCGVAIVQSGKHEEAKEPAASLPGGGGGGLGVSSGQSLGFLAVSAAAVTSGFSGVYQQKILQSSTKMSMWARNVQMGVTSCVIGALSVYAKNGDLVRRQGFFAGYTAVVWWVVALQALGGLNVAFILKYADNILKGFASAFSTVASCVIEILFFHFAPTWEFIFGATLINVAAYSYSNAAAPPPRRAAQVVAAASDDAEAARTKPFPHRGSNARKNTFRV